MKTTQVLADPMTRDTFKHIAKARHIQLRDLSDRIHAEQAAVKEHVQKLERQGLVAHKRSALPSLTTYYITSDGLRAERQVDLS